MASDDERALLARITAGDAEAFAAWASEAERPLRLSLRRFATACDVEAVLQEALLTVWQVAPRFVPDGAPAALLRFAVTAARNLALGELRRRAATPTELEALLRAAEADAPTPPSPPDPHLRAAVAQCHERLPPQPKQALAQRLFGVGADATLAAQARMSLNTFLQNVTRARRLLAECLAKAGIDLAAELAP